MKTYPLEIELMVWEIIKWKAQGNIRAVQKKIDRRIKQLEKEASKTESNQLQHSK